MSSSSSRARIVVIDDLTVFREMLAEVLSSDEKYEVVGLFADGPTGLAGASELKPDVAIVDLMLPGLSGLDVARRLMVSSPRTRIVLISAHERPELVMAAVEARIHGIVMKGAPLRTLREGLEHVVRAGAYYCPATSQMIRKAQALDGRGRIGRRGAALTSREREIVQLVASGFTTKDIASKLSLSAKTVSNHRLNIMRKLDVHDVATLTRYALERGLVDPKSEP